jgi:hypothetical protein
MKEEGNVANEDTKEVTRKPVVTGNKLTQEVTNLEKQDVDMEAMFHEWMKQVGRVYPNKEEERKRFELFKKTVKQDPMYGKSSVPYLPKSPLADRNYDEIRAKRVYRDEDLKELEALSRAMKVASFLTPKILFLVSLSNYLHNVSGGSGKNAH